MMLISKGCSKKEGVAEGCAPAVVSAMPFNISFPDSKEGYVPFCWEMISYEERKRRELVLPLCPLAYWLDARLERLTFDRYLRTTRSIVDICLISLSFLSTVLYIRSQHRSEICDIVVCLGSSSFSLLTIDKTRSRSRSPLLTLILSHSTIQDHQLRLI